jgi:hypothetical protein
LADGGKFSRRKWVNAGNKFEMLGYGDARQKKYSQQAFREKCLPDLLDLAKIPAL